MKHALNTALALSVAILIAGCSQEDREYFIAGGQGDWSVMDRNRSYATTVQPRRCYQTSSQRMTCFD